MIRVAPLEREERLLLFGFASMAAVAMLGDSLAAGAPWALAALACLWTGRLALGPFLAIPLTLATSLVFVIALLRPPAAASNALAWSLERYGPLGPVALVLVLAIPAVRFVRELGHPHRSSRWTAAAGLALVAGHALAGIGRPVLATPVGASLYALALVGLYARLRAQEQDYRSIPVNRRCSLSVTIIARNEADRIERCLASVHGWADEIVVLDSGSTDDTREIARRYTDKVFVTDWPGYGPQKQRALERATGDWVLSIDADEELTSELRHDIDAALGAEPAAVAYRLPWGVIVYGKRLDFGRSARAPLRLFRREGSRFTDAQVHETIVPPPGRVGTLRGRLLHHTQRDFGHALDKAARYAWLGARKRHAAGRRAGGALGALLRGVLVFVQVYVVRLGFLDGAPGLVVAALYAQVAFNKYAGLWALRRENAPRDERPLP